MSIPRHTLLNYIGIAIVVAGMGAADLIYWHSLQKAPVADDSESPYDNRKYEQGVEKQVGAVGLLMEKWSQSMTALEEPRGEAITIVVVSVIAAGGCFLAASRMPRG